MISDEKQRLRARVRALPPGNPADGALVRAALERWTEWQRARCVCGFAALPAEPEVLAPWPSDKQIALPRVEGGHLRLHSVLDPSDLVAGAYGIREPHPDAPPGGNTFDLILIPGVAFDRKGGRLGRGCGYYDRLLKEILGLRVGICFDHQIVPAVPCGPLDMAVDFLATPCGVLKCHA
jgi:5-formyltetrahydrofolate cyclo-ligase